MQRAEGRLDVGAVRCCLGGASMQRDKGGDATACLVRALDPCIARHSTASDEWCFHHPRP
jgi:hypothetical protein